MCKSEVEQIRGKFQHVKKPTWFPVIEEGDGGSTQSKFSGVPFLKKNEEWPVCEDCNQPMQLFVQLNIKELPKDMVKTMPISSGLIQMFSCTNPETGCDTWEPFSKTSLVRLIEEAELQKGKVNVVIPEEIEDYFPALKIVSWEQGEDYPSLDEIDELSLDVELSEEEVDIYYENDGEEGFPEVSSGEKLGGYPLWVQNVEYPDCPECKERMDFVFQIDSECNLPFMFGDCGVGHITQCKKHPHVLAFGWACS